MKTKEIHVKLESSTFGDYSKYVYLPDDVITQYEKTNCEEDNIIINYVLSIDKKFRKHGVHLDEKFIFWYKIM